MSLYTDASFIAAHAAPVPFNFVPSTGTMITFKTSSANASVYYVKAPHPAKKVLLVFHEWWGLNDYIKQEAEALQKELENVDVMAVDLFDGQVATTLAEASKISSSAKPERMLAIIQGAIDQVAAGKTIGTLGWCFGGGYSLQAAFLAGVRCEACVMYYGLPDTTAANLAKLKASVLGLFANKDKWITPAKVQAFAGAAARMGKSVEVKEYDADHAFANPSNPVYNAAAKEDADQQALRFLKAHL